MSTANSAPRRPPRPPLWDYDKAPLYSRSVLLTYRDIILGDGPLAYWRLDDTGTTAADFTGNGHTGTLTGAITEGVAGVTADGDCHRSAKTGHLRSGQNQPPE